ncbi:MAG: peroxiredoxin [Anaeroplasmataceae bacterium]
MIQIGQKAIDFTLPDEIGRLYSLNDFIGKRVVLYFYPKDNTSGCTNQALEFKRLYDDFKDLNAVIIGISKDSKKSHLNFKNKYELPFILLSDENMDVINKYEVIAEKSMYGKKYMGVVRSTFVIDENGIIVSIERKVNSSKNPMDTLNILEKIK